MTQEEMWLLQEKYKGEQNDAFFADCKRLKAGEPLAYLIGSIPFLNTTIYLDLPDRQAGSKPLIPRTETEFWVEQIISQINKGQTFAVCSRILDLCAGSGCIGVAVLKNVPNATMDFVEIDSAHHPTIEKNIRDNNIDISRTHIIGGDLFENVTGTYDYILTNPPYIDPIQNQTDESVKKYEPSLALYANQSGLEIIYKIIKEAPKFLNPKGVLIIEHDPEQSEAVQTHANNHNFIAETHPDQFGINRYTQCIRIDTTSMS